MQLEYVRDFLAVAKTLNYVDAADERFISHSSLFKHIKALERELEGELFEKDGKGIALTVFGQQFLPHAAQLVKLEDRCLSELSTWKEEAAYCVRLAADYKIWSSVYQFRKICPQYQFHYEECATEAESEAMLERGAIDFAILCGAQLNEQEFEKFTFLTDYMAAVLPASHPLAGRDTIRLSELADEDFVMLPTRTPHYRFTSEAMKLVDFTPHVVLTCTRGTAVVECITDTGCCSVMMEKLTKNQKNSDVAVVRLEPTVEIPVEIWKLKGRKLLPAAKAFLDYMITEKHMDFGNSRAD